MVSGSEFTATTAWAARGIAVLSGALGAFLMWFGWREVAGPMHAMPLDKPLVAFSPVSSILVPVGLAFLSFAPLPFALRPMSARGLPLRNGSPPAGKNFIYSAMAGALRTAVAIPAVRAVVTRVSAGNGYIACPPPEDMQRRPMYFVKEAARCP